jgi:catechol 2,3-dioxygenase-like lactoylglutathione lyase family enzyme
MSTEIAMRKILHKVDHLVYATPDVAAAVDELENLLGVRAVAGGQHPAWGTRNALIALGPRTYLEIFGPDPGQPEPSRPRPLGVDRLKTSRLATWVAPGVHLERIVEDAKRHGIDLGAVESRSRRRPDGTVLSWTMTDLSLPREGGIVPYFIDWGDSPHPAAGSPAGCVLLHLRAEHPQADRVRAILADLDLDLPLVAGPEPALIATIATPRGQVELR